MKINHKMLLAGAMAAIMSMSLFGCDGKNKETLDSTESGSSLDYLGEYSEEEGEDYLTASVGVYDKNNRHEYALGMMENYKKNNIFPDIIKSAEIDEDSVKVTCVSMDENHPVEYKELEFMFTYNGSNYIFTFRSENLYFDTAFSGVEKANNGTNTGTGSSATYRFGNITTTLSSADEAATEEDVLNLATAMCNSVKNKIKDLFIQFENEEGLPTFPEGAVIDKDFLVCTEFDECIYILYFTYNSYRYEIQFWKYSSGQRNIRTQISDGYWHADWHIGQWGVQLYSTNSSVTKEEITALATLLYDSMSAE